MKKIIIAMAMLAVMPVAAQKKIVKEVAVAGMVRPQKVGVVPNLPVSLQGGGASRMAY